MIVQRQPSLTARGETGVAAAVERLLDAVQALGPISPCAAQHAAHLAIVAGAENTPLIEAGIDAAEQSYEEGRARLFRDYQRFLRERA